MLVEKIISHVDSLVLNASQDHDTEILFDYLAHASKVLVKGITDRFCTNLLIGFAELSLVFIGVVGFCFFLLRSFYYFFFLASFALVRQLCYFILTCSFSARIPHWVECLSFPLRWSVGTRRVQQKAAQGFDREMPRYGWLNEIVTGLGSIANSIRRDASSLLFRIVIFSEFIFRWFPVWFAAVERAVYL